LFSQGQTLDRFKIACIEKAGPIMSLRMLKGKAFTHEDPCYDDEKMSLSMNSTLSLSSSRVG
jgi:hypothetical protein